MRKKIKNILISQRGKLKKKKELFKKKKEKKIKKLFNKKSKKDQDKVQISILGNYQKRIVLLRW